MCRYFFPFCGWIIFHCIDISHFDHSSVDGHLCCFQLLTIMNNAAINIHVQVCVWTYVFISPEELLSHIMSLCLLEELPVFSKTAAPFYIPISSASASQFLLILWTLAVVWLFDSSYPSGYEVASHYNFDLYFSDE